MNIGGVILIFLYSVYFFKLAKTGPNKKMMEKYEQKNGTPMTQEAIDMDKAKFKKLAIFGLVATLFFGAWFALDFFGYLSNM